MHKLSYYAHLSLKQKFFLYFSLLLLSVIVIFGLIFSEEISSKTKPIVTNSMTIKMMAPRFAVSPRYMAVQLGLSPDVSKNIPVSNLGITPKKLLEVRDHLLSHKEGYLKFFIYFAIVLWGLIFLTYLGRPKHAGIEFQHTWYPRFPYVATLLVAVIVCGFLIGKTPNPMESVSKMIKAFAGYYPGVTDKLLVFGFFVALAVGGNKLICGWGCPLGALQELVYTIPIFKKVKEKKIHFWFTNMVRFSLFVLMIVFLVYGIVIKEGRVLYHHVNLFKIFDLDFAERMIVVTALVSLLVSFFFYRPFCQFICPFGFISWILEKFSLVKVVINQKKCIHCNKCERACPLEAAIGRVEEKFYPADCFSCGRCLNVCPTDALEYKPFWK